MRNRPWLLSHRLKAAREDAEKWRGLVRQNVDPINERERKRRKAARNLHLLEVIATSAFESRKAELKGAGSARWSFMCCRNWESSRFLKSIRTIFGILSLLSGTRKRQRRKGRLAAWQSV